MLNSLVMMVNDIIKCNNNKTQNVDDHKKNRAIPVLPIQGQTLRQYQAYQTFSQEFSRPTALAQAQATFTPQGV